MNQYIIEVMKGNKTGVIASILRFSLLILSGIYYVITEIRHLLYNIRILKTYKLQCPVISVGNITAGGTGKTPAVITLARMLALNNGKVVVLSRGYKRKKKNVYNVYNDINVVSDGDRILLSPETAGDEPYLLAEDLIGVGVIVGIDRVKTGEYAIKKLGADILILDDGFQHIRLQRDLNIVTIDCLAPFGYDYLLPRGFLREPLRNLIRADVFLLTRCNQVNQDELGRIKDRLRKINSNALLVDTVQEIGDLERISNGIKIKKEQISLLQNREIVSVCSIGNPLSFEKTLEDLGAKVVRRFRFPDHYDYNNKILKNIFAQAGNKIVVTTQKDAVRIRDKISGIGDIFVLKINLEIKEGYNKLKELVNSKLRNP